MNSGNIYKKRPNLREKANPLSLLTFVFTFPTFIEGFKKDLEVTDLPEALKDHKSSKLGDEIEEKWEAELEAARKRNKEPSLARVLYRMFGVQFMFYSIPAFINEILVRLAQPLFLGQLISFYSPNNQNQISKQDAYLYAGGIIICSVLNVFLIYPLTLAHMHLGMKIRVACCSLVYRKSLKLSKTALGHTTSGQIVNLLSNDVNRFDYCSLYTHYLWIAPIQIGLIMYLMYREVEYAALIGIAFILLLVPLQFYVGKMAASLRQKTAIKTDKRIRLMNEIITGIQIIKMYTWENPFIKLVASARREEIKPITKVSYMKGVLMSMVMFSTRVTIYISVLSYILLNNQINAEKVFVMIGLYNVVKYTMSINFPQGIAFLTEASVSLRRIRQFLLHDEVKVPTLIPNTLTTNGKDQTEETKNNLVINGKDQADSKDAITIANATAKWTEDSMNTLTDINIHVKKGSLVAIIGPVGSGKSSILHLILKELPLLSGKININGKVSYASQEPWLFGGSVERNILFGNAKDKARYRKVVSKCALERDFDLFPYADKTIVGERGTSLSGGQRARINLARAVYKEADIYLLDDPLSAVDTHVGKQLFENCICDYLREKTVILVTHQLQYLKGADYIIILEDGLIKAEGSFNELQASGLDFAKLLSSSAEESNNENALTKRVSLNKQVSVTSRPSINETCDNEPKIEEEQRSVGSISADIYKAYFSAAANICIIVLMFVVFIISQIVASAGDYFVTFWVNLEQDRVKQRIEELKFQFLFNPLSSIYMEDESFWNFSTDTCIYVYTVLTVSTVVLTILCVYIFYKICMRASISLHNTMFSKIIHATMRFFNINSSGRILNRFSKDMGAVDELLPRAMVDCIFIAFATIATIVVVIIVNYWLAIPTVIISIILYLLRIVYIRTSRNIKRLEGVTRSPVFEHLNASIQGMTTIRAFHAQEILENEFDNHQDLHSSAWYLFLTTSRAFGLYLDLSCAIYLAIVSLSFLVLDNETFGGNVGLAITQALGLAASLQWGLRQSAEMENQMTSVERVLEYTKLEQEPDFDSLPQYKPPETWPDKGEIKFVNLYLRYSADEPPVLKDLNITVHPTEKVGIVGRTGAGKSSLISALFQLFQTEGSILIDGVEIKNLGLHDLRSKISIIPQEPVLFSGTMRKNLDPFDEYTDDVLWKALEEVELKDSVEDLPLGLNSQITEGGTNLSLGQRQLVCLARAIIRNNKILVLDEATASVDPQTDALIQHTIRKKFANCTVLTVAHRLHTIIDSDRVLVMDAGCVVEFDHPHMLLQNKDGVLYSMVEKTGSTMAKTLTKIAEDTYTKLKNISDSKS